MRSALAGACALALVPATAVDARGAAAQVSPVFSRIAGTTRFDTARVVAATRGPVPVVVLVSGTVAADAVSAAALAGSQGASLLLATASAIPPETREALVASGAKRVTIVGGPAAVTPAAESELAALGITVERVAGVNRYATSQAVARKLAAAIGSIEGAPGALVASGSSFADALAGAAVAAAGPYPLLLTPPGAPAPGLLDTLRELGIRRALVLGGTAVVAPDVVTALEGAGVTATRVAGATRSGTAAALARLAKTQMGFATSRVFVARGDEFADALALGPFAGSLRHPLLLTQSPSVPGDELVAYLNDLRGTVATGTIAGGPQAITPGLEAALVAALSGQAPGAPGAPSAPSGPDDVGSTDPADEVPPEPPTAADLIRKALASGKIDANTALLYRAQALVGDPALPAEFREAPAAEDSDLFVSIHRGLPTLSAEWRARLEPYVLRPNDPRSWLAKRARATSSTARARFFDTTTTTLPAACAGAWDSQVRQAPGAVAGRAAGMRVWACRDAKSMSDISAALPLLGPIWDAEVALMGPPLSDAASAPETINPDGLVDVYLIPLDRKLARSGSETNFADAVAMASSTTWAPQSPAFLLLDRAVVAKPDSLRPDFAHELFHAIQYGINLSGVYEGELRSWIVEASAAWAEMHFAPIGPGPTYDNWFKHFQKQGSPGLPQTRLTLARNEQADAHAHDYWKFAWFYFLEQEMGGHPAGGEGGGAVAVRAVWDAVRGKQGLVAVDQAADTVFPFKKNFAAFALQNVNEVLPGNPIPRMYHDLHHGLTPATRTDRKFAPRSRLTLALTRKHRQAVSESLPPLFANYYRLGVNLGESGVHRTIFDFRPLPAAVEVQALIKVGDGTWKLVPKERITENDRVLDLCRDRKDAQTREDWTEMILIVSNSAYSGGNVTAPWLIETRASCFDRIVGDVTQETTYDEHMESSGVVQDRHSDTQISMSVVEKFDRQRDAWVHDGGGWSFTGTDKTNTVAGAGCFYPEPNGSLRIERQTSQRTSNWSGNGQWVPVDPGGAPPAVGKGYLVVEEHPRDSPDEVSVRAEMAGTGRDVTTVSPDDPEHCAEKASSADFELVTESLTDCPGGVTPTAKGTRSGASYTTGQSMTVTLTCAPPPLGSTGAGITQTATVKTNIQLTLTQVRPVATV